MSQLSPVPSGALLGFVLLIYSHYGAQADNQSMTFLPQRPECWAGRVHLVQHPYQTSVPPPPLCQDCFNILGTSFLLAGSR